MTTTLTLLLADAFMAGVFFAALFFHVRELVLNRTIKR